MTQKIITSLIGIVLFAIGIATTYPSLASSLPVCESEQDTMLGACEPIKITPPVRLSAANLSAFAPAFPLPTIRYIGQEPFYETPNPALKVMKTIPLEFPEPQSDESISPPPASEDTSLASNAFPIPYKTREDAEKEKTISVNRPLVKTIPLLVSEDNLLEEKKEIFSRAEACFLVAQKAQLPLFESKSPVFIFSDVSEKTSFFSSINALKNKGAIDGYEDGSFRPEQHINTAEAYKILAITAQLASPSQETRDDFWFIPFKKALNANGITTNAPDAKLLSKEEFTALLNAVFVK